MGLLTGNSKPLDKSIKAFPVGCFTVDRDGRLISSTLPQAFSPDMIRQIGQSVLVAFQSAHQAQLIFYEIQITYPAVKITARELRGGAIVFLAPSQPVQFEPLKETSEL
jgi:hypothetical protein